VVARDATHDALRTMDSGTTKTMRRERCVLPDSSSGQRSAFVLFLSLSVLKGGGLADCRHCDGVAPALRLSRRTTEQERPHRASVGWSDRVPLAPCNVVHLLRAAAVECAQEVLHASADRASAATSTDDSTLAMHVVGSRVYACQAIWVSKPKEWLRMRQLNRVKRPSCSNPRRGQLFV